MSSFNDIAIFNGAADPFGIKSKFLDYNKLIQKKWLHIADIKLNTDRCYLLCASCVLQLFVIAVGR